MERDRDRSNLPPSVICLNRPKYMYSNLSMSTEDYHYHGAYRTHHGNDDNDDDDLRNYTVIKRKPSEHHHYYIPIHTVRENSYTESMVINSPQKDYEYPLNKRQENSIPYKSTKSSPSYYYITPTPKHKLSTLNAWDTEYTSTELEQNEAKSYDYHNPAKQNDNQPFIRDINNRKSSRRSARITELVNLLTKNLDEENKHNTHGVNHKNRPVSSTEESGGLPEGNSVQQKIQQKSFSGKLPRTISLYSYHSQPNQENNEINNNNNNNKSNKTTDHFNKQTNKLPVDKEESNCEDKYSKMSISDRIACIRQNSLNWRERVERPSPNEETTCDINKIRMSLYENQESWRKRAESRNEEEVNAMPERIKKSVINKSTESQPVLQRRNTQDSSTTAPKCLPAEPILRNASKENRPESKQPVELARTKSVDSSFLSKPTQPAKQASRISQNVKVPPIEDKALSDFFTSKPAVELSNESSPVQLPTMSAQPDKEMRSMYERIVDARRAARPEKRKPPKDFKNPLKALEQRENIKSNYEEVRTNKTTEQQANTNLTPFQPLLRAVDPSLKVGLDFNAKNSILAESAKAGLTSTEDINEAKSNLRTVQDRQSFRFSSSGRLLPYKSPMLLHIKGRRHVQVRLVAPSAKSMNSGDCFVLITTNDVFAWFGESANIVEVNKTRELASWIYKKHELSYHGSLGESVANTTNGYISVHENANATEDNDDGELDNESYVVISDNVNRSYSATLKFWKTLGYDSPQNVHPAGPPEEDERYELMIQRTNRVYRVTPNELVPCEEYWGNPVKYKILQSDQAFVFDFGSEMYLWTGKQITSELRQAGIELAQKAYNMNYDFRQCQVNPLDPMNSHNSDILASGCKRPDWTILGKVTDKGETVLFKEKFFDWPDTSRIQLKSLKPGKSASMEGSPAVASLAMEPYSAVELYDSAVNNPPPPPNLLTLEGRYVGRGGRVCRYEDGILRQFCVETAELRVWHVSEFARFEMPITSHGQFHKENTYVIRWSYKIAHNSVRNGNKRNSENIREHCAYFFWQGSQSKITEKGAAALMTIELDEERGPQIRVIEGKEPPVFCHLFSGRMIVHDGKRTAPKLPSPRMFIVRGEVMEEGHLIEVPVSLSSLRPQGVLFLIQCKKLLANTDSPQIIKAYCWIGHLVPKANLITARYVLSQLKKCCPSELGTDLGDIFEIHQNDRNEMSKEFLNILQLEDQISDPLCLDAIKAHSRLDIWQFTHHRGRKLGVERLNYALQPDPSSLPLDDNMSTAITGEGITERLLATKNLVTSQLSKAPIEPAFPFLLGDLYGIPQPSLFLIVSGLPAVYIWQGWWPVSGMTKSRFMSQKLLRSSSTYSRSSSTTGEYKDDCLWSTSFDDYYDYNSSVSVDGSIDLDDNKPPATTGTGRARFFAVRKAAMHTAKALADKLNTKAYLIYAGLEPPEFLALFPPYDRATDSVAYHQCEEGKTDGQKDLVDNLLDSYSSAAYTLSDLQQRPLPPELDATCLETYLDDKTFQAVFSMSREEFAKLPIWKQTELKKPLGLF